MKNIPLIPAIAVIILTGCQKAPNDDVSIGDMADNQITEPQINSVDGPVNTDPCHVKNYTAWLGSHIDDVSLPADLTHRIAGPNGIATMDYAPHRLNIETDADGVVIGLSCG